MRSVDLEEAIRSIRAGGLVAFPTETVYGLGARADDERAVARIFAAKGRPRSHPLIVHVANVDALDVWARTVPATARRLADLLWPGPLTLVLPRRAGVLDAVTGGRDTVALRMPRHPIALALVRGAGAGIAAPSANKFGRVSPTTPEHVAAEGFDDTVSLVDGGPCEVGLESTILDVTEDAPVLLRPGGVDRETLESLLGAPIVDGRGGEARAPGMLEAHYAPRARVVPVANAEAAGALAGRLEGRVAYLGRGRVAGTTSIDPGDREQFARTLYATLRMLDVSGHDAILIELPDERGVGVAIADRVRRAAHRG